MTMDRNATPLGLWVVLARAFGAVERHSRTSIARFGLNSTEFGVLEVLYHKGELPVCDARRPRGPARRDRRASPTPVERRVAAADPLPPLGPRRRTRAC